MLRKATMADFSSACETYRLACEQMQRQGVNQWRWGEYPNEAMVRADIEKGELYVDDQGLAVTCINQVQDRAYDDVNWLFGQKPGSFHRLALRPESQGRGLGKQMLMDVEEILRAQGCDCLRIDTYQENAHAQQVYEKYGMRKAGEVRFFHREKPFICYEKPLRDDCCFLPLRMHPAFRAGALTPWGGEKLRGVYGKDIPCVPCGESLEVSCIPGLESRDDTGTALPQLIARWGAKLAGRYAEGSFPLLLKIIDAKDTLSVQVHPDDDYALEYENGKRGKAEAWLILDAPEGSELVYGINRGVTQAQLRAACQQGEAVEPLLRRVKVKPGDVCMIPAGCVHAIGKGIMLYEIQQSSDITYRFYDWNRVDKNGKGRELHLEKALAVTNLWMQPSAVSAPEGASARVLENAHFTLDLLHVPGACTVPEVGDFGFLTALESDLNISWQGGALTLPKGATVYLPAAVPALTLEGHGRAALSMPGR